MGLLAPTRYSENIIQLWSSYGDKYSVYNCNAVRFIWDFSAVNSRGTLWALYFVNYMLFCIYWVFANSMKWIVTLCENLILHVSDESWYISLYPFKLNRYHTSERLVSLLHFSVELFISMVYTAEPKHYVSASVKWKVPYSLLASEFVRCLQAQWWLLGIDWGTRQLVFTTVIDS